MTENTARPMIDFSSDSRATARDYARLIDSRTLDQRHRTTLHEVALGKEVDAYRLNEALMAAMRSGLTRFGQSLARRSHGKRVAHLAYIAQAVIEAHADALPTYEQGERSRKIEELKAERAAAERSAKESAETLRAVTKQVVETHKVLAREAAAELSERTTERDALARVLTYAMGRLSPSSRDYVLGYWDAVNEDLD